MATRQGTVVRSIAIAPDGRIYVGGKGEFGFFTSTKLGRWEFVSLSDSLPQYHFSNVWKTHVIGNRVYFGSTEFLFSWSPSGFRVWRPHTTFSPPFLVHERLYIVQAKVGLMELRGDSLTRVPGGEYFSELVPRFILPYEKGALLIGSERDGLTLYDQGVIKPFTGAVQNYVKNHQLYHACVVRDSLYALATLRGGVVLMDSKGNLIETFSRRQGLLDDQVWNVFCDKQGGLWMALNRGVSRLNLSSPLRFFGESLGLHGNVQSITRHEGKFYVATSQGVYRWNESGANSGQFDPVQGIQTECWEMLSTPGGLLVATSRGIYRIERKATRKLLDEPVYVIRTDRQGGLWVGLRDGFATLHFHGAIARLERSPEISNEIRGGVEEADGSLWLGTNSAEIIRMNHSKHITRFATADGLPGGWSRVFEMEGTLRVATAAGIYRFDNLTQQFSPDERLSSLLPDPSAPVAYAAVDPQQNIWLFSPVLKHGVLNPLRPPHWESRVLNGLSEWSSWYIHPISSDQVWFANSNGLICFSRSLAEQRLEPFKTILRTIRIGRDSIAYGGATPEPILNQEIVHAQNTVSFTFSAPSFDREPGNEFRFKLEGFDETWSDWMAMTQKEYTNLFEGEYRFIVQARDLYEQLGEPAVFSFRILPPWYRTWWAYFVYSMFFVFLVFAANRFRFLNLERKAKELEAKVESRTLEINQKNKMLNVHNRLLKQLKDQQERINDIVKTINTELSMADLMRSILRQTRILQSVDKATVLVRQQDTGMYRYIASDGWAVDDVSSIEFTPDEAEQRYTQNAEQIFDDVFVVKSFKGRPAGDKLKHLEEPKAMLAMRIHVEDRIEGYLIFDSMTNEDAFETHDLELLLHLKEHIISAFVKARMLEELRALNEKKNEFLGIAAHDLRNPLSVITLGAKLMERELQKPVPDMKRVENDLTRIAQVVLRMNRLINDLLDVAAIESGRLQLNFRETNLNDILLPCVLSHEPVAEEKRISLEVDENPALPAIQIDSARIAEVCDNLVSNAIKYTEPGGWVRVATSATETHVEISVQDSGQGLNEDDLKQVFTSYKKLSARPTAGESSTGLGLAIVKKIVEGHGGTVRVESEKGRGSIFTFALPLRPANGPRII